MKFESSNTQVAPSFATQPANQSVFAGSAATFHAVAVGTPAPTYQWQRYVGTAWTNLSGATAADYTTPVNALTDTGAKFRAVASNTVGSTPSSEAVLTVLSSDLTFTLQPVTQKVALGSTATFTALAVAGTTPVTYQWYRRTFGGAITAVAGAKSTTCTAAAVTLADDKAIYFVRAFISGAWKDSGFASLSVLPTITLSTQVVAQRVEAGSTATFSVAATAQNAVITYQWYSRLTVGAAYLPIAGATAASYTTPALLAGNNGVYYFVRITACGSVLDSSRVPLTVIPAISISQQPLALTVKEGQTATFSVTATVNPAPMTYQWYKRPAGATTYALITGATATSYTTPANASSENGAAYFVRLTAGAGTKDSTRVPLTVDPAITITTQPVSTTVLEGLHASFTVAATANVGSAPSFKWQRLVGSAWTDIAGASTASYSTPAVTYAGDNLAQFRAVASNANGISYSSPAQLTVTPVSPGGPGSLTAVASGTTLNLQWSDLASNEIGYRVYLSTSSTKPAGFVSLPANSTTYSAAGLVALTKYYLWVESYNAAGTSVAATTNATTGNAPLPVMIDDFNSSARWISQLNSLGKAITTSGGNYNLEGDAALYFNFNGGTTASSFTETISQSLAGQSSLVLAIKGGGGGEQTTITLVLNDGADHSVALATYGTLTTTFQNLSIPLSAFGANLASVAFLRIEGRGLNTTVRLDEIRVQ